LTFSLEPLYVQHHKNKENKMSLKGTKTKENLEAAFAGESQAIEDIYICTKSRHRRIQ
jgi:hypothetical protein